MILNKIEIRGFGPHTNTVIDLNQDITAIIGHNGAGKTFALEAVPAVLFGTFPSRGGSILEHITQDHYGDALIAIEFVIGDTGYRAERKARKTTKTCTQECYLFSASGDGWAPLAGPKQDDFKAAITRLVGDSKLFMSGVFSSQTMAGDLIDAKPTERKAVLAEMLELERFQAMATAANEKARGIGYALESYQKSREMLSKSVRDESELAALESEAVALKNETSSAIAKMDESIADLQVKYSEIVEQGKKTAAENEKAAAAKKRLESIQLSIHNATMTLNSAFEKASRIGDLQDYQNTRQLALDKQSAQVEKLRSNSDLSSKIREIDAKTSQCRMDIRIIETAKETALMKAKTDHERNIANTKSELAKIEQHIAALEKASGFLASGDFTAEQCQACQFTKNAFQAKEAIQGEQEAADKLKDELDTLSVVTIGIDTREQDERIKAKNTELAILETQIKSLNDQIVQVSPIHVPADRANELATAFSAKENIPEHEKILATYKAQEAQTHAEIAEMESGGDIVALRAKAADVRTQIERIDSERKRYAGEISKCDAKIGEIQAIRDQNKRLQIQIDELDAANIMNKSDLSDYQYLARAFGRNGIQALLIDAAIPSIQSVSDELLQIATEGRMRIEISTQKELKSGGTSESLEILCSDASGVRDVQNFSGGEQKILRTILRMAMAIFQASRSAIKVKTLFIDELFDSLDQSNAHALLETLGRVSQHFERVVFISHSDELLADFGSKIELKKDSEGTIVV